MYGVAIVLILGVMCVQDTSLMALTSVLSSRYDPEHICNGSDNMGRYAYNKQPEICKWNLGKLAEALVPELPLALGHKILEEEYDVAFQRHYLQKMRKKLGLIQLELEEDGKLISDFLDTMNLTGENDYTHITLINL